MRIDASPTVDFTEYDFHGTHDQKTHGRKKRFAAKGFKDASPAARKRLRIPPAWRDVQVDEREGAALLAVGTDAKGREQRVYSAAHHEAQAAKKFARIQELHNRLPAIDKRLSKDAETDDTALAALLIRRMGLRPGSDSDTGADKKASGATNLKASEVDVTGDTVRLRFTGKKGVDLDLSIDDGELARYLSERLSNRNRTSNERLLDTSDKKLRDYMKKAAPGVKPKDFRTYLGTSMALGEVKRLPMPKSKTEYTSMRKRVGETVAKALGNTPTVALESYIAPAVFGPWDKEVVA